MEEIGKAIVMGTRGKAHHPEKKPKLSPRSLKLPPAPPSPINQSTAPLPDILPPNTSDTFNAALEEQLTDSIEEEKLSAFSIVLRDILRHDRTQITRVANELEVSPNTVYRWMNGHSIPRPMYLRGLLDVLSEHRVNLVESIYKTFPDTLDAHLPAKREIHREIERQIREITATTEDDHLRMARIEEILFSHLSLLLDSPGHGLSITYAQLMPPQDDGLIHSLREAYMRGSYPWPTHLEYRAYLGSTAVTARAITTLRFATWEDVKEEERVLVTVDDREHSFCAHPVMRHGRIAGVLLISSEDMELLNDAHIMQISNDSAHLLSLGLRDSDFVSPEIVQLRPMPSPSWQHKRLSKIFSNRITQYARIHRVSRIDAEQQVIRDIELEFEELAQQDLRHQEHEMSRHIREYEQGERKAFMP